MALSGVVDCNSACSFSEADVAKSEDRRACVELVGSRFSGPAGTSADIEKGLSCLSGSAVTPQAVSSSGGVKQSCMSWSESSLAHSAFM